jgi:hypothetical protein
LRIGEILRIMKTAFWRTVAIGCAASVLVGGALGLATPPEAPVSFDRDIRPILSNACFRCHGPDDKERKADLRLDTKDGLFGDLGGHAAVVPGNPAESELLRRISATEAGEKMPPPKSGKKLTAGEIDLLTRWIKQGAVYNTHWSYTKPTLPTVPRVNNSAWPQNAVDRFILARLEREGLAPSPEADRYTLIRRVSLDLTGLPPTWQEVQQFVEDKDPKAYEHLVDRLLEKAAYGEHWAYSWLDLARYADSAGYADDPLRTIWLFRDYVIKSLNANKPFDQFTIEQIAGDLLPNPTEEQLIATAFHRNTLTNNEGGTVDEEFRNVAVVDRVSTTMAVWMGTTMACAQCHNHKYDPITQEEFFRFFAFFNNTQDADRPDESPVLSSFTSDQQRRRERLQTEIATAKAELAAPKLDLSKAQSKWEQTFPVDLQWRELHAAGVESPASLKAGLTPEGGVEFGVGAKKAAYSITIPLEAMTLNALRIEISPAGKTADAKLPDGDFVIDQLSAKLELPKTGAGEKPRALAFRKVVADHVPVGSDLDQILKDKNPKQTGLIISGGATPQEAALTVITAAPEKISAGSKLVLNLQIVSKLVRQAPIRLSVGATPDTRAAEWGAVPRSIRVALRAVPATRLSQQTKALAEYYHSIAPELAPARQHLADVEKQFADIKPVTVPVMREMAAKDRRVTKIQHRGNYLDLGSQVTEGVPAAFPPLPQGAPLNRLSLARWLISPENPLTARVLANRYWEQLFGTGIVATSEDFGVQGDLPYHPELLDWLASEMVRQKWELKGFLKMLVMSATYRQSSLVTPELQQRDPDNRLLARGPRFRLSAEMVRDQALFVSGLLSAKMYGPPVNPPQPNIGLKAAFGSDIDWKVSAGEDRHRRALYTMWRRSNPYPSMAAFDAPNREVCTVRRVRTNTPLQALVTLNDPVYMETAQSLARKAVAEGGAAPAERVDYLFRFCLSRKPEPAETARLVKLYENALTRLRTESEQASKLATDPIGPLPKGCDTNELAAWTLVGNVMLNLDEALMKR